MKGFALSEVVWLADPTLLAFEARRPGCARALLHDDGSTRAIVLRVEPNSGVPAHQHSSAHDLFLGIKGELEIRWEQGCSILRPGGLCRIPPGVRHEVRNRSEGQAAYCMLLHTGPGQFDFIEADKP